MRASNASADLLASAPRAPAIEQVSSVKSPSSRTASVAPPAVRVAASVRRIPSAAEPVPRPAHDATATWHDEVLAFKRGVLEARLTAHDGNRTHTARSLGLQRTYLLRLLRDLHIDVSQRPRAQA
jgi:DNA-binding NtrC family response regulator